MLSTNYICIIGVLTCLRLPGSVCVVCLTLLPSPSATLKAVAPLVIYIPDTDGTLKTLSSAQLYVQCMMNPRENKLRWTQICGTLLLISRTKRSTFTWYSQHSLPHGSCPRVSWLSVSAAGPAPEGICLQPLVEVISSSCTEDCRVKVSCHSGCTLSSQHFVCKSVLINLTPQTS